MGQASNGDPYLSTEAPPTTFSVPRALDQRHQALPSPPSGNARIGITLSTWCHQGVMPPPKYAHSSRTRLTELRVCLRYPRTGKDLTLSEADIAGGGLARHIPRRPPYPHRAHGCQLQQQTHPQVANGAAGWGPGADDRLRALLRPVCASGPAPTSGVQGHIPTRRQGSRAMP